VGGQGGGEGRKAGYRDHEDDADDEALVRGLGVVEEVPVHEAQRHHRRRRGGRQRRGRVRRRGGPPLHPARPPARAREGNPRAAPRGDRRVGEGMRRRRGGEREQAGGGGDVEGESRFEKGVLVGGGAQRGGESGTDVSAWRVKILAS